MLESEAFKGQLIKATSGAYTGKRGIIHEKHAPDAEVWLEAEDSEKGFITRFLAYDELESLDANVSIKANGHCHIEDASAPTTKHYDEHYASMIGLEPIELMQLVLTYDEFIGFLKGNIIKYTLRAGKKQGEAAEKDLAKAKRYTEWLIKLGYKMPINPKED